MKPSEKNVDHLRPLVDAMAFEVRAAVETIGPAVEHGTQQGMRTYGAQVFPLVNNKNATSGASLSPSQTIYGSTCRLMGWTLFPASVSGYAAVKLYDGVDADGDLIIECLVGGTGGANLSAWFGPGGIALERGLYVDFSQLATQTLGQVVGSFFLYPGGAIR